MYGILKDVKNYVKKKECVIDNFTFQLHYRFLFAFLLACSLLATANYLAGDKIHCYADGGDSSVINSYCWIQGTFTVPSQINEPNAIHPGVSHPTAGEKEFWQDVDPIYSDKGDELHHAWYQWVAFVLFIQAVMCHLPHDFWKAMEGGKLSALLGGFERHIIAGDVNKDDKKDIVDYLERSRGTHNLYALQFLACEFLNLINVILQAYLIDWFLGGEFTTYGTDVILIAQQPIEKRVDPMIKVFPRQTKCSFNLMGKSGTNENIDSLCILAINIINEKIYIIIWFLLILLMIWTAVHLMIQMMILSSTNCRVMSIKYSCNSLSDRDVRVVLKGCNGNYGDYFLLKQMACHTDPMEFNHIIQGLKNKFTMKQNKSVITNEAMV